MGLFSELGDAFLGGAEKKAAKEDQKGFLASDRNITDTTATARADAMGLTQGALDANRGGFAAALDTWNRNMPRQAQTVQEGNRQAQIQRIAGMRQSHNALLGSPIDYSQIIPRNAPNNANFIASLPTGPTVAEATSTGGVANDLANLPFEAKNIMGMLQEGRITTEEAHNCPQGRATPNLVASPPRWLSGCYPHGKPVGPATVKPPTRNFSTGHSTVTRIRYSP